MCTGRQLNWEEWQKRVELFKQSVPEGVIHALGLNKTMKELQTHKDLDEIGGEEVVQDYGGHSNDSDQELDDSDDGERPYKFEITENGRPYKYQPSTLDNIRDFWSGDLSFWRGAQSRRTGRSEKIKTRTLTPAQRLHYVNEKNMKLRQTC